MDSATKSTTTTDTDEANEVSGQPLSSAGSEESKQFQQQQQLQQQQNNTTNVNELNINKLEPLQLVSSNGTPKRQLSNNYSTSSPNQLINSELINLNTSNDSNECQTILNLSNNVSSNDIKDAIKDVVTLTDESVSTNSNQPELLYNDYVNHVYNNPNELKHQKSSTTEEEENDEEEVKPLLNLDGKSFKPKSIVKSPSSTSVKPTLPLNGQLKTKHNKRLSWQANDPTRTPQLHVQFNNNNTATQSTSLDSSEEGHGEDCPSSPITSSSSSSSSSDEDEFSEIKAPDGGYGWLIVFASFMVNMIADGITFSFGVYNVEFLNYFGESKGKTAWIGSIFMASPLLSGPIASYLTDRYGCRKVTIAGSILASIGFVLSAFAESMEMLFITFGIIAGVGLSLCYVAAVVIVAYYFDKKRSFATGISVCGSGIGTFIFPPIINFLITEYGWRGCTLILAGVFLNMCVCGALMRDLEWTTHRAKQKRKNRLKTKNNHSFESFSVSTSTAPVIAGSVSNIPTHDNGIMVHGIVEAMAEDDPHLFSSLITLPTFVRNGEKIPLEVLELLAKNRNFHDVLRHNYPHLMNSRSLSVSDQFSTQSPSQTVLSPTTMENSISKKNQKHRHTIQIGEADTSEAERWLRNQRHVHRHHALSEATAAFLKDLRIHRHSLTYRGAMLNINRYRLRASSCPDIYRNSMTTIAKEEAPWHQLFSEFKRLFADILDFSYFKDIRFLLFAISNLILYTWYDVVYVYLPDYAVELGATETDASFLISLIGIVNMFGEIVLGWAGDREELSANVIYAICMGFCGIAVLLIPFFISYQSMCVLSSAFGLFIAANYSLTSIILVNLVDIDRFTNAYGLLLLVQGIANLVGPPLAGWGYDLTGKYDLSFHLAGGFIIVSGLLLLILPVFGKYKKHQLRKESKANIETLENSKNDEKLMKNVITDIKSNGGVCV